MKVLLDTPLLAELFRAHADDWVARWIDAFAEDEVYLSILTVGEIVRTIEAEPDAERRIELHHWVEDELLVRFHGRILPLDMEVITEWGRISAECENKGKPIGALDGMIAATARTRGLVLVTYNRDLFTATGIEVSDPWQG